MTDKPLYYESFVDTSETEPTVPASEVAAALGAEIVGAAPDTRRLNAGFAARHSLDTPEWYTPAPFVEAARATMGRIDLDPASHAEANLTVRADAYYTEETDGLARPWIGRVFINPPGGLVAEFWTKLIAEWQAMRVDQAVWIGYSLEQLQTLQSCKVTHTPLDFAICIPKRRISFVENEAKRELRLAKIRAENAKRIARGEKPRPEKNGPSHGNYIAYIGHRKEAFRDAFETFGQVVIR